MNGGERLRAAMDAASEGKPYKLFFYTSPYLRSRQVCAAGRACLRGWGGTAGAVC